MKRLLFLVLAGAALAGKSPADVILPKILSNGMVLQCDVPTPVYGRADPGEAVEVEFLGRVQKTTADADGKWAVSFAPEEAGGPFEMTVKGRNAITLSDVWLGDVWICSGQSNIELPMRRVRWRYPEVIANCANPQIRYFDVDVDAAFDGPREDVPGGTWKDITPDSVLGMSAAAYFFAREVNTRYKVPVGIIDASMGGSPIEAWMSESALSKYPADLQEGLKYRSQEAIDAVQKENDTINSQWFGALAASDAGLNSTPKWFLPDLDDSGWETMTAPGYWDENGVKKMYGSVWFRRNFTLPADRDGLPAELDLGTIVDSDVVYINGVEVGRTAYQYPPRKYHVPEGILKGGINQITIYGVEYSNRGLFTLGKPFGLTVDGYEVNLRGKWKYRIGSECEPIAATTTLRYKPFGLFNAMLAPLFRQKIMGAIWYQGESNAGRPGDYRDKLATMIEDWRKGFADTKLPFIVVQLPNWLDVNDGYVNDGWAPLREQERKILTVPNTSLVVTVDIGEWNDLHPLDKGDVGKRIALSAFHYVYGERNVVGSGPLVRSAKRDGNAIVLSFARDSIGSGLMVQGGGKLRTFAVAAEDGLFVPAEAVIVDNQVRVYSTQVPEPVRVRYAWSGNPPGENLYNCDGLPASPFEISVADDAK